MGEVELSPYLEKALLLTLSLKMDGADWLARLDLLLVLLLAPSGSESEIPDELIPDELGLSYRDGLAPEADFLFMLT